MKKFKKCINHGQILYNEILEVQSPNNYCSRNCTIFNEEDIHLDLNEQQCNKSSTCPDNEKIITLDNNVKKCDCENLYYNDITSGLKVCIDKNEINCTKQLEYPYLISGTKQCSHTCDGIISLNGYICYTDENYQCPENSNIRELSGNLRQCVCEYKYYHFDTDISKEIYCLPEDSKCPRNETFNRELFIKDTQECVEYCPFDNQVKKYGKTCVKLCPIMSVVVNDECFCQDKWYMDEKDEMICTDVCPNNKKILIDETKECVETCINTKYPFYYKNKCYLDCSKFPETEPIYNIKDIESSEDNNYKGYNLYNIYGEFGESICYCKGPWYEEGTNNGCNEDPNNFCNVFDELYAYKFTVLPTKQCVKECPENYTYSFNDYCFESCEKGNELLKSFNLIENNNNIVNQDGDSKICKCENLWKFSESSKIECLNDDNCESGFLLIVATKECYNGSQCREENPLLFNNKCYNEDNCPVNTIYKDDSPKTCSCIKYYYIDSQNNNNIECLPENEACPEGYYLINSKNKCVQEEDSELNNYYNFNGIYYNNCPRYTKYDEEQKVCICDNLYRYWHIESNILYCGLENCPNYKTKYIIDTKECLLQCSDSSEYKVEYNGICYRECPDLTKEKDGLCELETTSNSNNSTEFAQTLKNNIVNLYKAAKSEEGENEENESKVIDLVNSDTTVEFYGVNNKKKESKMKHNTKKETSSLSYIDLSECIQKIYENNDMNPNDDIIILKFDLKTTPKEYLINPVEYKFLNSRNGQELDASVCAHGSIKISYPFSNIISYYDKLSKKKRNLNIITIDIKNENDLNTLSEKYNIGKEINKEYSFVDSFNSKDKIYTDFCTSI